ncbi:hypothetical protein SGFS_031480 [Streptomyces graminofaciens]|uniref:Peptidase M48 domain-containing protein n=1 Tax=Streptomyces graminofaciens TaxID=68212 RepID=A0ABN5VFH8_9ACTN|nr:M48 family metalloprotease [Streptomyces graminofaciens]BBC31854.1 hypothetical protein SGFS_031480 [Streptomyces graminofaciens]
MRGRRPRTGASPHGSLRTHSSHDRFSRDGSSYDSPPATPSTSTLPHPTSTQFLLLLLMLGAASLFAGTWWGVLTRDGWASRRDGCLRRAAENAGPAPGDTAHCVHELLLRESAVTLIGPAVVLALAGLAVLLTTFWRLRRWRRHPLPVPGRTTAALKACLTETGYAPAGPPRLVVERRGGFGGVREEARAYGLFGRRYVVVANYTTLSTDTPWSESDGRIALAGLRHEIAHLRAGDVGRGRFAFHALWVFPCVVVLPLAVAAVGRPADLATALGWRLAAVTVVVLLAFAAFVRTREYEADAASDTAASDPGGMAFAVETSMARGRTRLPEFLRLHPHDRSRLRMLKTPGKPGRALLASCLIAGVAVGSAFQEIALLSEAATGGNSLVPYWLTGLLAGTGVTAVVSVSVWRRDLAPDAGPDAHGTPYAYAPLRDTVLPGALLGLALVVGSQLSPRAAAAWERLFPSALVTGDNYSLLGTRPLAALPLVAAPVVGGVVFLAWSRALARVRSRAAGTTVLTGTTVLIVLGGLVLSVPLALWFQLQRLVATSYVPPRAVARVLLDPVALGALGTTGLVALALLCPQRWRPALALACVCAALLPLTAMAVGTVVEHRAGPAPPLTRPSEETGSAHEIPERSLPIAPSATTPGRDPAVEPKLACYIFSSTPTERLHSPDGLEEVAERMKVTRDTGLRSVVLRVLKGLESARTDADTFDVEAAVLDLHAACKVVQDR